MKTQTHSLFELLDHIQKELQKSHSDAALCKQYAWWLLEHITKKTRTELVTHHTITLSCEQESELKELLQQIIHEQMPIQYALGSVPFLGLTITVKPPILIPRPETEQWCYELIERIKKSSHEPRYILDLCTGSGCIALALAQSFPNAQVIGVDINHDAIELARHNSVQNKINNVQFIASDLYQEVPRALRFDLIVSNPPYISRHEAATLSFSVTAWEDPRALFADNHGYALLEAIIKETSHWLASDSRTTPQLCVECGYQQSEQLRILFHKAGYKSIDSFIDDAGHHRAIYGTRYEHEQS